MKLAIGFFDGVHLGHRAILAGADAALTFANHPLSVLAPERAPKFITPPAVRLAELKKCVPTVHVLEFDAALAAVTPLSFLRRLLRWFPDLEAVRCGGNWRFGAAGAGDARFLRERGLRVEVVPYATWRGFRVSSTRIRTALAEGDVAAASAMLGRPYVLEGDVRAGKGLGRDLGFPTINVVPDAEPPLRRGVYAVDTPLGRGLANWGVAPSAGDAAWTSPVLEVHLENRPDVVPDRLDVEINRFVRDERKFETREALVAQIAADVQAAF